MLDALNEAGIRDRTTIFVVCDHGFINTRRSISPNVLLEQHGLIEAGDEGQITRARVQAVSVGGTAMVFATDPAMSDGDLGETRRVLDGAEGIARILAPAEYARYGLPLPATNEQSGDLVLVAEDDYGFSSAVSGDYVTPRNYGHHGFLADNPRMARFSWYPVAASATVSSSTPWTTALSHPRRPGYSALRWIWQTAWCWMRCWSERGAARLLLLVQRRFRTRVVMAVLTTSYAPRLSFRRVRDERSLLVRRGAQPGEELVRDHLPGSASSLDHYREVYWRR